MTTRWIRLAVAAGLLTAWATLAGSASAARPAVVIAGFDFAPTVLTAVAGDTVTWTNSDTVSHTVTGAGWDAGTLAPGSSVTATFAVAGSFTYACRIHPTMTGTVAIGAQGKVTDADGTIPPKTDGPAGGGLPGVVAGALLALAAVAGLRVAMRRFGDARIHQARR